MCISSTLTKQQKERHLHRGGVASSIGLDGVRVPSGHDDGGSNMATQRCLSRIELEGRRQR